MKITNHPSCTHTIGAPTDMQDGSCAALPVRYEETLHGLFAISYWQPEPDDLVELLAGGGIELWVRAPGRQHPVVALGTFPCTAGFEASGMQMEELAKRWYGPVRERLAAAEDAARAAIAYDFAIQCAAGDPDQMSSYCTAQGDTLDTLYAVWLNKSRAVLEAAK